MIVVTSTTVQTRVLPRTGAKPIISVGMTLGILGMLLFTSLPPEGEYASHVLPGLLVLGVGMGCIFAPAFGTATLGVDRNEVGGSVGTALLSTIFATAAASWAASHPRVPDLREVATVHGYTVAFYWAAGLFGVGLIVALLVLPPGRRQTVPAVEAVEAVAAE
jgi:MFS family permease